MSLPKKKQNTKYKKNKRRYENKKHLSWIHNFPCILNFTYKCQGRIEAHHLMRPWSGNRGMGMKSGDQNLVPLCSLHHRELHHDGQEERYFEKQNGNSDFGKQESIRYWLESPYSLGEFIIK